MQKHYSKKFQKGQPKKDWIRLHSAISPCCKVLPCSVFFETENYGAMYIYIYVQYIYIIYI